MKPIDYIPSINNKYQALGFPAYLWSRNDDAPLTPLARPLARCRVSMLTTCGASTLAAPPFNPDARNDQRLDAIDPATPDDQFQVHDNYYDHTDVRRDINCQFPLRRLAELARLGLIGEVAPRLWSGFMGRTYNRTAVIKEAAPAFAGELAKDRVDLLILVPACPLDHQTAGLVARVVEAAGIPTVTVSTGRDITASVKPPRTAFVNFPMGNAFGRPFDTGKQTAILRDALALSASTEPGCLVDLPYDWGEPFEHEPRETSVEYQLRK